jgi:hypothetical protein
MNDRAIRGRAMSRTTRDAAPGRAASVAAVALALALLGAGAARAGEDAPGIWTYNCWMSYTIYNLTNYELKNVSSTVGHDGNCRAGCDKPLDGLVVEPYRTWKSKCDNSDLAMPCNWSGSVVIQAQPRGGSNTLQDWAFEVAFKDQAAHGLLEHGTWIYLLPHGTQGWSIPASADTWAYQRWATTINDAKMHNIMTLVGPKVMVALYSPDNKNLVIVVQQYWENAAGWDDSNHYQGWQLDWVDNDGSTVPR